jgi:hypothetical protein
MKIVKCINNTEITGVIIEGLTKGKNYIVISENKLFYLIEDDNKDEVYFRKRVFEEVKNELSIIEASNMPIGTEFKMIRNGSEMPDNIYIDDDTCLRWERNDEPFSPYVDNFNAIFIPIKVQKPVEFITAWKALEDGNIIESTYTLDRYRKKDGLIKIQHQGGEFYKCGNIATSEIANTWVIID